MKTKKSSENWPILGEDYIKALHSITNKHGIKITDEMILKEVKGKQYTSKTKERLKSSHQYFASINGLRLKIEYRISI